MIVLWKITERCSLRCPFCACDESLRFSRKDADPGTVLRFGEVLASFARSRGQISPKDGSLMVSWLGGEPFLWPHLEEIERVFVDRYKLRLSATTNGTQLSSSHFRSRLLDRYAEITVSLDTTGKSFDKLRGWAGGFDRICEGVKKLSRERSEENRKLRIRINSVLTKSTISGVADFIDVVSRIGVDELTFNVLGGVERPEYYAANAPSIDQLIELASLMPRIRSEAAEHGLTILGSDGYYQRMIETATGLERVIQDCRPGEGFIYIGIEGLVAPCFESIDAAGKPLEELSSAAEITSLPQAFRDRLKSERPPSCKNCRSTRYYGKFDKETG